MKSDALPATIHDMMANQDHGRRRILANDSECHRALLLCPQRFALRVVVLAGAPIETSEKHMTLVSLIDLLSFLALVAAVAGIIRGWKSVLSRDSMLLLLGIAIASLFHSTSNVLEWSGITAALDPYEDYLQLIEPILWFFFANS